MHAEVSETLCVTKVTHQLDGFLSQLNDCHRGVVFDGLETLFAQNQHVAASAVLRALNNRRFIYFVTLKHDYAHMKEQEKRELEEKGGWGRARVNIVWWERARVNIVWWGRARVNIVWWERARVNIVWWERARVNIVWWE